MSKNTVPGRFLILAILAAAGFAAEAEKKPAPALDSVTADQAARITKAVPAKARAVPAKARKLLVFCRTEGFAHKSIPWGNEAVTRLGAVTGAFTVEVSNEMEVFTPERLAAFDAVLFNNTTQLKFKDLAQRTALMEFLKKGKGLVGLHAATDNFPTWPEAQALIGGVFHGHPWNANDTVAVKLDEPSHPLVAAFEGKGFWIKDEIYQIDGEYSRDRQRVLLSLDMSKEKNHRDPKIISRKDNDFPISWIKQTPEGIRVFYSSLGHREDIYTTPEILSSYLDGIQFALGDLAADAAPSASLKVAAIPALAPDAIEVIQDRHKH